MDKTTITIILLISIATCLSGLYFLNMNGQVLKYISYCNKTCTDMGFTTGKIFDTRNIDFSPVLCTCLNCDENENMCKREAEFYIFKI
jgi:hypothetical protein